MIDAKNPDNEAERINITIPLDIHGRMLVNWLNKEFVESFRHESVVFFHQLDEAESNIVSLLEVFDGCGTHRESLFLIKKKFPDF